jgi:hypothetical protein
MAKFDFTDLTLEDAIAAAKLLTPIAFKGAPMRFAGTGLEKEADSLILSSAGKYHRWRFDPDGAIWCYENDALRGVASLNILAAYEYLEKYKTKP